MSGENVYERGKIVMLTEGCYSDFGNVGGIVTLVTCDFPALTAEFVKLIDNQPSGEIPKYRNHACDFVAWLVVTERVAPLECGEFHVGSYSVGDDSR